MSENLAEGEGGECEFRWNKTRNPIIPRIYPADLAEQGGRRGERNRATRRNREERRGGAEREKREYGKGENWMRDEELDSYYRAGNEREREREHKLEPEPKPEHRYERDHGRG